MKETENTNKSEAITVADLTEYMIIMLESERKLILYITHTVWGTVCAGIIYPRMVRYKNKGWCSHCGLGWSTTWSRDCRNPDGSVSGTWLRLLDGIEFVKRQFECECECADSIGWGSRWMGVCSASLCNVLLLD